MVNSKWLIGEANYSIEVGLRCHFRFDSVFTIYDSRQEKEEHRGAPPFDTSEKVELLPGWCRGRRRRSRGADVYINLCRTATKQASPKNISRRQDHDHKDHQHRDNSGAAATTTSIVSHKTTPFVFGGNVEIS